MPRYGDRSLRVLETLHPDLQLIFKTVLATGFDHTLICGHRPQKEQDEAFALGRSKVRFPNSKHNSTPSMAVDAMPWFRTAPNIDWSHSASIYHLAGVVRGVATGLYQQGKISHLVRWGGDWDGDFDVREKQWDDSPHYELYKP
mgnify:CR=1 FL=1